MFLPCRPCCATEGCGVSDGKPRTDPATEGHWVPSGTWETGVTWTFDPTPSTTDGGTWFFYGSAATSKVGGGATTAEQRDWGNICNWYSNKTTTPSSGASIGSFNKRATRLPPETAVVHVYSDLNTTSVGAQVVKTVYFWSAKSLRDASELTTTALAHDSTVGTLFFGSGGNLDGSIVNNGAMFFSAAQNNNSTVNGSAVFNDNCKNAGVVNNGAVFNAQSFNSSVTGIVNGGAVFNFGSDNYGTVNGGATFNGLSSNLMLGIVNGGAVFNDSTSNRGSSVSRQPAIVNDGAVFNGFSFN